MNQRAFKTSLLNHEQHLAIDARCPVYDPNKPLSKEEELLFREMARLDIPFDKALTILALVSDSPNAREMTTEILRTMDTADWHDAFEAMTRALVTYPTAAMNQMRMPTNHDNSQESVNMV